MMPPPQYVYNGLAGPADFDAEVQITLLSFVPSGSLSIRGRPPLATSKLAAYSNIDSPYMMKDQQSKANRNTNSMTDVPPYTHINTPNVSISMHF